MYVLCINLYTCLLDNSSEPGTVSTPLIPTLGMQRQVDFFKSEANQLGLLSEFQDSQGCVERLLPQKKPINQNPSIPNIFIYTFYGFVYCFMCMSIASVCVCTCVCTHVHRGQKIVLDSLELQLQCAVTTIHRVGAATLLFCKRNNCS